MAIPLYLAMTTAEFAGCSSFPAKIGWMACHFSPYGTGLSNLPDALPKDSLLIVNDRTPICGHDPELIAKQLTEQIRQYSPAALLLDFQRRNVSETQVLTEHLLTHIACPTAVSECYAAGSDCPVFLPPVPVNKPLSEYIAPWAGREIWLDLAVDAEIITLTAEGAVIAPVVPEESPPLCHREERLHCHYSIETGEDFARFTLWRTKEDVDNLQLAAEALGVHTFVGLRQELGQA